MPVRQVLSLIGLSLCIGLQVTTGQESTAGLGMMNTETVKRIANSTTLLDLNVLRVNPALLDDQAFMKYFIALNNCQNLDIQRRLNNELDFPGLAAFYKARAHAILADVPPYVGMSVDSDIDPPKTQGTWRMFGQRLTLGDYDRTRGVFPLIFPGGKRGIDLQGTLTVVADRSNLRRTCPVASMVVAASQYVGQIPSRYGMVFSPRSFSEFPLDETAARRYIDSVRSPARFVTLAIDFRVLDRPAEIIQHNRHDYQANLNGDIARITVVQAVAPQTPIGVLFDSGTLAANDRLRPNTAGGDTGSVPPAPRPGPETAIEIDTLAYLKAASEICGWPLSNVQRSHIQDVINRTNQGGSFNAKLQLNMELSQARTRINQRGALDFCEDGRERQKFDRRAAALLSNSSAATDRR